MGRRDGQTARRVLGLLALLAAGCPAKGGSGQGGGPTGPTTEGDAGIDPSVEKQVAAIAAAMNHYGPAIHTCWSMAAADEFRVQGVVMLRLVLGSGGTVESVDIEKDEPGDRVLSECLVALWKEATWPDVFSAGDSIRLPPISFVAPDAQYVVASAHATSYPLGSGGDSHATILLDYKNTGNSAAAMSALTLASGMKVSLHKHDAAEILYILKGGGQLTTAAKKPLAVTAGSAIYIPKGAPHAFEATEQTVALQLYAPAGNEQRFRGVDTGGTVPLERITAADRRAPKIALKRHADVATLKIVGGSVSLLFDAENAPDQSASVAGMTLDPSSDVPSHRHDSSTEILFVIEGGGTLTIAGESREVARFDAIQVPPGVDHAFRNGTEMTKVVQFYTPSGPEQRFKSK